MADLLTSMKKASQRFVGVVADTGAKTMLKTDVMFLERDIKARKQEFGVQIFDILQSSAAATADAATLSSSEVQQAYEACRADIQKLDNKVTVKKREMTAIEESGGQGGNGGGGGSSAPTFDSVAGNMEEAETPGIPSDP